MPVRGRQAPCGNAGDVPFQFLVGDFYSLVTQGQLSCAVLIVIPVEIQSADQLRLYFSSFAYVLGHARRRLALAGTEWAHLQVSTICLRLLKIAA